MSYYYSNIDDKIFQFPI